MRLLSYTLSESTPTYADNPKVQIKPMSLIEEGGVANWFLVSTINHNGTHLDAPWHFNPEGAKVTDLGPEWFVYSSPVLVDVPKDDDELIYDKDLIVHENVIRHADLLLVRTGYGARVRDSDPERYGRKAPGFHPSAARYLKQFTQLRAVGMDLPSAGAPNFPEEAAEFHRIALGAKEGSGFFLIIEDMRLDPDLDQSELKKVIMAPLLLENLDGAPVTVFTLD